jgi:hypothetical protein
MTVAPLTPAEFPTEPLRVRGTWKRRCGLAALVVIPSLACAGALALMRIEPEFYLARLCDADPNHRHQCSNQFLASASRLINDIQNSPAWEAQFAEDQINGWLAEDFERNHASKALPRGVRQPRVVIDGDQLRLAFRCQRGPLSMVVQIGGRAWVPKRNLLAIELEAAQAGLLPLPTTYTRTVIEQFILAQNLEISWKRNGARLVALIDFQRSERDIVLRRVEIKDNRLRFEGISGRHAIPATDYAPTAN